MKYPLSTKILAICLLTVLIFFVLHIQYAKQIEAQLLTVREIFNKVYDAANARLMTTAGLTAQPVKYTETEVLNNVYDKDNNLLRTSGGGGGGGPSAFNDITSGSNTTATMTVGTGGSIVPSGSGIVEATIAQEAAAALQGCSLGQYAHNWDNQAWKMTCAQVQFNQLGGAATDAQIPNLNTLGTGLTVAKCVQTNASTGLLESAADACGTGSGVAAWGAITGTLSAQTDLQAALDAKQASLGFTAVPNTRTVCGDPLSSDVTCTKGDVGLANVDNTSNTTERAATRDLSNARFIPRIFVQADTSPITIDPFYQKILIEELSQATTFNVPTGTAPFDGQTLEVDIFTTVPRALTFVTAANGFCEGHDIVLPTVTVAGKRVKFGFEWVAVDSCWSIFATPPASVGSGAPIDATYWVSEAEAGLSGEINLGALTSGVLCHTVAAGVSTPATCVPGTNYQAPLANVTDDAQLKRAAGDFATFTEKANPVAGDLFLIEDSAAAGAKKKAQIGSLLLTPTQVGLSAVTNDAQLKRAAGDIASFTDKPEPAAGDLLLIEDSAAAGVKKKIQVQNLLFGLPLIPAHVGLGNVTNDAQLKRAAGDFASFTDKATPVAADVVLIEDSAASGAKKDTTIGAIRGTGTLHLAVGGYTPPAADPAVLDASGTWLKLKFDNVTRECALWQGRMNADYVGGLTLKAPFTTTATTGSFHLDVRLMVVTPGSGVTIETDSYGTNNDCNDAVVPGTASAPDEISCSLANTDSLLAGLTFKIEICRDITNDDAAQKVQLIAPVLEYTK